MQNFTDNKNREWSITMDQQTVDRVYSDTQANLTTASVLDQLVASPELLVDVIYSLIRPQAEQRGIAPDDFGRSLRGNAVAHATNAMLLALVDTHSGKDHILLRQAVIAAGK